MVLSGDCDTLLFAVENGFNEVKVRLIVFAHRCYLRYGITDTCCVMILQLD